jgi:hypothetical protein
MDINSKVKLLDNKYMFLIGFGIMNFRSNDNTFNLNEILVKTTEVVYLHYNLVKFFDNEMQI